MRGRASEGQRCTRGLRCRAMLTERHCLSLLRVGNWESQEPSTGSGTSPPWEASLPMYSPGMSVSEGRHPFKLSPLHTPCTTQTLTVQPPPQVSNKPLHRERSQTLARGMSQLLTFHPIHHLGQACSQLLRSCSMCFTLWPCRNSF